jgi:DNA-binding transcriptional MerR regulator
MTIGQLSRRTGVPIKVLRKYEDLGFLYTLGRSRGNYRLFSEETLQCVQVAQRLRALGLTLKEIQALIRRTCQQPGALVEGLLDESLTQALARVDTHISVLQALRQRILAFQAGRTKSPPRPEPSSLVHLLAREPGTGVLLSSLNDHGVLDGGALHKGFDSSPTGRVYTLGVGMSGRKEQR